MAWGIDDGMPDVPSARQAFNARREDGIIAICSTPHFVSNQPRFQNRSKDAR
ncbi:hypothetical protein [Dubosiella newyorkensis]|uniref:hypothetical protein n=1 Tax=Dubosiella newyorkensis TaxID=1862672 RepID=UPI003F66E819